MQLKLGPVLLLLLTLWPSSSLLAAEVISQQLLDEVAGTRLILAAKHRRFVEHNLPLEAAESGNFWPLYEAYMAARREADDLMWQAVLRYAAAYRQDGVSDALAEALLQDGSRLLSMRLEQRQRFLPQFRQVLSAVKVARFFQIVNKQDALVRMELSQKIPLVD